MQLAIFDLDGTITRRDTLVPYVLGYLVRHPWRLPRLVGMLPALLRFAATRDRGDLKAALIRCTLGGLPRQEIADWSRRFVRALLAGGTFTDARNRIASHHAAGDYLVLMSASPNLYVPLIGEALGFSEAICTEVHWQGELLEGRLTSANRRGVEKSRCLATLRARHPGLKASAYGNSGSDIDHLARVERGVLVNASKAARRLATGRGIHCERWR
jgi:phosphatidylglycerophosphatase C